ncbi:hypothetical protein ABPG74_001328 [Tetrahymena malaccensis]
MSKSRNNYNREEYKEDYLKILPPGTEENQNVYGNLYISLGDLMWLKTPFPPENTKIRVSFWGQQGNGRVIVAKNCAEELKNYYVSELEYEIRCPVVLFQKYLQDMVKLKIDILDKRNDKVVGNVFINMLLFLKNNPKAVNTPIEDIKGLFPIFKVQTNCNKPNMTEKIGEIELEMNVRFTKQPLNKKYDPSQQHLDSSFMYNELKANQGLDQHMQEQILQENRSQQKNNDEGKKQSKQGKQLSKIQEEQSYLQSEDNKFGLQSQQKVLDIPLNQNGNQRQSKTSFQERNIHFQNEQSQQGELSSKNKENLKQQQEEHEDEQAITNVKIQKIIKDKQSEEYLHMLEKQQQKIMEQSTRFDEFEILDPDLELLKLRMDEAELISGLTAGVYADLVNVPPEKIPEQENLDLKSVNTYVVHADSFLSTNMLYKKKLQKSQLSLTIQVPILEFAEDGTQKVFYDQLYIPCRRQLSLEQSRFEFNQSFPCKMSLRETNISQFTDSRIYFQLFIGDEDPSSRIEFARGEFRFDQLLLKPYLKGAFEIPMYPSSNFVAGQGKNTNTIGVGGNTKTIGTQNNLNKTNNKKESNQSNQIAGELCISVALLNKISPYLSDQINLHPTTGQRQKQEIQTKQSIKRYAEISNMNKVPFQIFLFVTSLNNMSRNVSVNEQILIRHKLYGRNENLEGLMANTDFATKSIIFNYKSIMPVDEQSIQKMNVVPFVLEIWKKNKVNTQAYSPSAVEDFLGLIRLNMKSIPELILNPQAFASNVYPTLLVEGEMPIWDPSTNKNIGICNLALAFGTVQQIQFYEQKTNEKQMLNKLNQQSTLPINQTQQKQMQQIQQQQQSDLTFIPKNNKNLILVSDDNALVKHQQQMFIINDQSQGAANKDNQAEALSENVANSQLSQEKQIQIHKFKMIRFDNMEYSKEGINKVFVLVMENIRRNKRRAQNILRNFILKAEKHQKRVTLREFYNFLNDLPIQETLHIKNGYLHKLISVLDFEESGEINTTDFVKSYNSFLNYEDILRDSYSYAVKEFSLLLINKSFTIADFERIITRFSEFGFVRREHFKSILEKDFDCDNILVNRLIDLLDIHEDGLIQSNMLPDYLRNIEVYEKLNYIHCDSSRYAELVKQNLQENVLKNEEGVQELIMNDELADKVMSARDIQYLIQGLGLDISFWEATCIIESIRLQLNVPVTDPSDEFSLPFVYLSDWLQFIMKQKKEDPQFNYYSYLVEQRNRIIEEQLLNNQLSDRRGGQKSVPVTQRNQNLTENSSNKYTDRSQNRKSEAKQQIQEDEEEDLIQLVKNNYKKV